MSRKSERRGLTALLLNPTNRAKGPTNHGTVITEGLRRKVAAGSSPLNKVSAERKAWRKQRAEELEALEAERVRLVRAALAVGIYPDTFAGRGLANTKSRYVLRQRLAKYEESKRKEQGLTAEGAAAALLEKE